MHLVDLANSKPRKYLAFPSSLSFNLSSRNAVSVATEEGALLAMSMSLTYTRRAIKTELAVLVKRE